MTVAAPRIRMLIDGQFVESATSHWQDVINPATQDVLAQVPFATTGEVDAAVAAAKEAFKTWRKTPIGTRARIFLKYQQLIRENMSELAHILTAEQGKTLPDAEGDVFRGLEVVEHAAAIGNLQLGELANNVANGVDTYTIMQPLGVCAGITPFNFPAMIPLWMFPMAIATGNTFILKPSEQDPMVTMRLVELALEAGIPKGGAVFQQHGEGGRVLAAAEGLEIAERALGAPELAQRHPPRGALEQEGDAQHAVAQCVVAGGLWVADVLDAFVGRNARACSKHQQGDDEAPEVEFAPIAEGMHRIGCLAGTPQAVEQQQFVEGVDQRMHALAEHGRAAGDARGDELGHGDGQVAGKGRIDDKTGTGGSGHQGEGEGRRMPDLPDGDVPGMCRCPMGRDRAGA